MIQIQVANLVKHFGSLTAMDNVSFSLSKGEFLTLLGPSGSGKTTTLMAIAGFVETESGSIQVAGRDITRLPPNKRDLGVVFQSYALFPHKSVFENVAFPLDIRGISRRVSTSKVMRMLDLIKLGGFGDRSLATLSGGQKQRVALARALIFEPPVLLMDEPLGALDRRLREHMQVEIKNIQKALGITAILVTHDQDEALAMSDRIAVMEGGRIVQLGTPREVYDRPANRFVAEFLGGVNLLPVDGVRSVDNQPFADIGPATVPIQSMTCDGGKPAWLGIRPERVQLSGPQEQKQLLSATITQQTFIGSAVLYGLKVNGGGYEMLAKVSCENSAANFEIGTQVGVRWDPESARLLA